MKKINLFCLPFAGGSKYSYKGYLSLSPNNINMIPIELPGRGGRFKESLLIEPEEMVEDYLKQIISRIDEPYAIYGHSMGSYLGNLLTRKIVASKLPAPMHLFFSGCTAPALYNLKQSPSYNLPREKFFERIKEYGGLPDEVLNDNSLMVLFEGILRADFQAIETYKHQQASPYPVPITIMIGSEERVTLEEASQWQTETTEGVEVRQFPGRHFFIFEHEREIVQIISEKLNSVTITYAK